MRFKVHTGIPFQGTGQERGVCVNNLVLNHSVFLCCLKKYGRAEFIDSENQMSKSVNTRLRVSTIINVE